MLAGASSAFAYSVAVRWTSGDIPSAAGYRVYVRPAGGSERAPIDVPRPRHDGTGRFEIVISDLSVETTYTFALSAYGYDGTESERSNSYTIGYGQASTVVDSDHDGLTDAEEDTDKNQRLDGGETNRLVADTDADGVPDGLEREFGSDPLDGDSPSCRPLDFSEFRVVGTGTANVGYDAELDDLALATSPGGLFPTSIGVMYPQYGKGDLREPILVTRVRSNDRFRIEVHARSIEGKLYRLRFEGLGRIDRTTRRRLRRNLGNHFSGERYELVGFDVAGEMARMDPGAILDRIERITVRGSMLLQRPQICH
jgi:hypothetical protein